MTDREPFDTVATEIVEWQVAAQRLPLADLAAVVATWQNSLAESLNAFNDILDSETGYDEPSTQFAQSIGEVTRRATAVAIFTLGIAQRARLTARQN